MSSVSDSRSNKRDILQAVYEDNLHTATPTARPRRVRRPARQDPAPRSAWRTVPAVLVGLVGVLLAGLLVQGLRLEPPVPRVQTAVRLDGSPRLKPVAEPAGRLAVPNPGRLPIAELFNLKVNTIVIDPGHGGRDPGAVGVAGGLEKDITLDVGLRLRDRLARRHGARVLMTRETDVEVPLGERVAFANENGADLFVSLHVNSIPDASVAPLETYYFGLRGDDATLRLAHGENAAADYSVAEFNTMIQRAGNTVKFQESRNLAQSVQTSLVETVRRANAGASDWGVKAGPFVVLLGVEAPAILAEMAAISNPDEEARLDTDAHRERLARSLEEGIAAYLQARPLLNAPTPIPPHDGEEDR
ncbi:MAG: N-acetylmuramoyl-L-alanine amidase [Bacteroidota bacterium]